MCCNINKTMKNVYLILAAMLLLCLAPMPYGYYSFIRVSTLVVFGVLAYKYYNEKKEMLAWSFGFLAVLFQPFAKVALGRVVWNIVDVIVAIGLLILFFYERKKSTNDVIQVSPDTMINPKVSKLVITNDYRILLPDYYNIEIKLEPLVKAVYLLFLKHPEGIVFKDLTDYREELKQIYSVLRPNGITDKALQSIEDVTNPMSNSINEKCARIRGVFVGHFGDDIAQHYYIDGLRGELKKISLPRDLVVWE